MKLKELKVRDEHSKVKGKERRKLIKDIKD